jgi:hypothetical protein
LETQEVTEGFGTSQNTHFPFVNVDTHIHIADFRNVQPKVLPDLLQASSVKQFRHWSDKINGDPSFLPRLRLIRIYMDDERRQDIRVEQEGIAADADGGEADVMTVDS